MTPLLQHTIEEIARKRFRDDAKIVPVLRGEVHPFEVSEVYPAAMQWAADMHEALENHVVEHPPGRLAFLPAPVTWIERADVIDGIEHREGFLLREAEDLQMARVDVVTPRVPGTVPARSQPFGALWLKGDVRRTGLITPAHWDMSDESLPDEDDPESQWMTRSEWEGFHTLILYALLAMINTPRIFGRVHHKTSWTQQRKLAAAKQLIGKFPLLGWTEIKLDVTPPEESETKPVETHLTGERALHFCRAYLWISRGVVCPGHWRGNPAIGMKQTRYRVTQSGQGLS